MDWWNLTFQLTKFRQNLFSILKMCERESECALGALMAFMNHLSPDTGFQPPSFVTNSKILTVAESQLEWTSAGAELTVYLVSPVIAWDKTLCLSLLSRIKNFVFLIHQELGHNIRTKHWKNLHLKKPTNWKKNTTTKKNWLHNS